MLEPILRIDSEDIYPDPPELFCSECGQVVWYQGYPDVFEPCMHTLLFTDGQCDVPSFATKALTALALRMDREDGHGSLEAPPTESPTVAEGLLFQMAPRILEVLPRPSDPKLYAYQIECEYCTGFLVATRRLDFRGGP